MSLKLGSLNRFSCSVSRSGCMTTRAPTTITASCRPRSARARKASERCRSRPVTLRMLRTQAPAITAAAMPISQPGLGEAAPDRLQVVRHRDRRQGDHDQVIDQDRPAGDEGDKLVEGVAGEGRRAAALAEHRPALDVAERGQAEQQARGEEDQRRQAEAAVGDDPEGEVDREADRRVGGGEQPGDADAALERAIAPPWLRPAAWLDRGAHRSIREETQSRPAPTTMKATPIKTPTEAGPPPFTRVTVSTSRPIATKTSEKVRTAPR